VYIYQVLRRMSMLRGDLSSALYDIVTGRETYRALAALEESQWPPVKYITCNIKMLSLSSLCPHLVE
jgi:hypothetical protein